MGISGNWSSRSYGFNYLEAPRNYNGVCIKLSFGEYFYDKDKTKDDLPHGRICLDESYYYIYFGYYRGERASGNYI